MEVHFRDAFDARRQYTLKTQGETAGPSRSPRRVCSRGNCNCLQRSKVSRWRCWVQAAVSCEILVQLACPCCQKAFSIHDRNFDISASGVSRAADWTSPTPPGSHGWRLHPVFSPSHPTSIHTHTDGCRIRYHTVQLLSCRLYLQTQTVAPYVRGQCIPDIGGWWFRARIPTWDAA